MSYSREQRQEVHTKNRHQNKVVHKLFNGYNKGHSYQNSININNSEKISL